MPDRTFDLVLNSDSFPEIPRDVVAGYLRAIARKSRRYFFSINQESEGPMGPHRIPQTVVPRLADEVPALSRVQRFPYWLRRGYVEELYEVGGSPSFSSA
jgi:hypothetical protein